MLPWPPGSGVEHAVRPEDLAVGQVGVARGEGVGVVRRSAHLEVDEALVDQRRARSELVEGERVVVPEDVVEQRHRVGEVGRVAAFGYCVV